MKINLTQHTLHFRKPARTSRGEYTVHDYIAVTITDDEGHRMGVGECAPLPDLSCDRAAYRRMSDVADLINKAFAADDYADFLRPYPALLFALESAMYDYQQNPLLYDTPFARGEVGIPMNGLVWMADYEEMARQVEQKLEQGFSCVKLKIGAINWDEEIRLVEKIRSRFSPEVIQLRVDANGAFSPEEATTKMRQLATYGIHSIEQPIKAVWQEGGPQSWQTMATLCKAAADVGLPIALDEELIGVNTLEEKRLLLDTIHPQYIVLKPTLHGGISGTLEWIAEADRRGIKSWITSALEGNIGLRSVALLAACAYGSDITFPQGLGTGQLYLDNVDMGLEIRGEKLFNKFSGFSWDSLSFNS